MHVCHSSIPSNSISKISSVFGSDGLAAIFAVSESGVGSTFELSKPTFTASSASMNPSIRLLVEKQDALTGIFRGFENLTVDQIQGSGFT